MALTPSGITQALRSHRATGPFGFNGNAFERLVVGLGNGLGIWAVSQPQNLALFGAAVGTAGLGAVSAPTTRLVVPPTVPIVQGALVGAGLNGPLSVSLATTVAYGVSQVFTQQAQYLGVSGVVGVGQDVSKITVANPVTLTPILVSTLAGAFGAIGAFLSQLAVGLANGISGLLLQGTGTGTVVGSPSTAPAAGPTNSVVV